MAQSLAAIQQANGQEKRGGIDKNNVVFVVN